MDILAKLFSSASLVKIMRLFLLHPNDAFDMADIRERSQVTAESAKYELGLLKSIGFLKKKVFYKEPQTKRGRTKKKVNGWTIDPTFPYLTSLRSLLIDPNSINRADIMKRLRSAGTVKLVVLSGIFVDGEGRADILVVGDKLNKRSLDRVFQSLSAEVGKELAYAVMDSEEFKYRLGMYDKFLRDVFDSPHEKLIDRLTTFA